MRNRSFITRIRLAWCYTGLLLLAGPSGFPQTARAAGHSHAEQLAIPDSSDFRGEMLLFPAVTVIDRYDQGPKKKPANSEVIPEMNFFYTADYQQFRFLGEWLVSTKTHNLERIQFGLHLGESSLWLGRFHNPIGYWNMQYHHGAFLQNTTSRPGIMAFETQGGVIPNHLTGLFWEGVHQFDEAGLYYSVGAGAGPYLKRGLSAFNVIEPGGSHRPGATFRLGYQPVSFGVNEFGISGAYTEIPSDLNDVREVKQFVAGAYANWQQDSVHLLSEVVYANSRLEHDAGLRNGGSFFNAYAQAEWAFADDWTLIGRIEGTRGGQNDPYLALFPRYVRDRLLGGLRYRVNSNMALKVEASQDHIRDDRYGQVMFQWSAVFP